MINWTIDLGQIFLGSLITVIGYFIKRELSRFDKRLDSHDTILQKLIGDTQRLIGIVGVQNKTN